MRLERFIVFRGIIECKTGLHIGGSVEGIEIGGVDNPVIKHPITKEPYIPGSSLKGKMRSSLEKEMGKIGDKGGPCNCNQCIICRVFGPHTSPSSDLGPTRIIVRDANLNTETKELWQKLAQEKGGSLIEQKTENVIDRVKGTALHPRTMERVAAGAKFDMEIVLQILDKDLNENKEQEMINLVKRSLSLVEQTYLGGFGSRGSGQVKFLDLTINDQPFTLV